MNTTKRTIQPTRREFAQSLGIAAAASCAGGPVLTAGEAHSTLRKGSLKILSCNIRVALLEDDAAGVGWKDRKNLCMDIIETQHPDVVCFQETLWVQVEDLKARFKEFAFFGFEGPEMDGRLEGYHGIAKNVIMYSQNRYEAVTAGGFWLSETPHLPGSMSWDTARARHVNWVRLKERATGREFRILTTHLDHRSQLARERQIQMIIDESTLYADTFPQLLAGDLNARITNPVLEIVKSGGWTDTYEEVHGPGDPGFTTHRFLGAKFPESIAPKKAPGRIDFIFSRGRVKALDSHIIRNSRDGRYPSDHFFISAKIELLG